MTTTTTASRPWSPTDRDRMIYRWVKFEGHKQTWVAEQLGIDQSTVSRIVDRYERWIAHGGHSQHGSPKHDERLRAQICLTYERNEWIISSALRIAGQMEQHYESSETTIHRGCHNPNRETQMISTSAVVDRSSIASRYLRLAHRINMDQLALVEREQLPALEPLTLDVSEFSDATADSRSGFQYDTPFERDEKVVPSRREGQEAKPTLHSPAPELACAANSLASRSEGPLSERTNTRLPPRSSADQVPAPPTDEPFSFHATVPTTDPADAALAAPQSRTDQSRAPSPLLHSCTRHNPNPAESTLTPTFPITSAETSASEKTNPDAYQAAINPPETTDPLQSIIDATLHQSTPPIRLLTHQLFISPS